MAILELVLLLLLLHALKSVIPRRVRVPEAEQVSTVLVVVDIVLEKHFPHFKKRSAGEQAVGARLMLRPDALQLENLADLLQPALQVLTRLHQILDVVNVREKHFQQVEKLRLVGRQRLVHENLEQVSEIVAGVKGEPVDVVGEDDAGRVHVLCERHHVDAVLLVNLELYTGPYQQIDGVLRIHILADVETEIKLPRGAARRLLAVLIVKREPDLNDLEQIDVAAEQLILVVGRALELPDGPRDDPRELGIHGDVGVLLDDVAHFTEFLIEVIIPHVANLIGAWRRHLGGKVGGSQRCDGWLRLCPYNQHNKYMRKKFEMMYIICLCKHLCCTTTQI